MQGEWVGSTLTFADNPSLTSLVMMAVMLFTMVASIAHFSYKLPRREHFWVRLALIVAVALTIFSSGFDFFFFKDSIETNPFVAMYGASIAILLLIVVALTILYDASIWSVIFCATAGYTTQNFASSLAELTSSLGRYYGMDTSDPAIYLINAFVTFMLVLAFNWLSVVRRLDQDKLTNMESKQSLIMLPAVALIIIGFDVVIKSLEATGVSFIQIVFLRFIHMLVCMATLWLEYEILYRARVEQDKRTAARLAKERERQYELSRETIEAINVKCHDIRHQIRSLTNGGAAVSEVALNDLANEVSIYDSAVKTGNEALDTILTEKNLICENEHITLTCIADGEALNFMAAPDLYALFGNALDNAIEAVRKLDEPAKRSITLVLKQVMGTLSIHIENYCAQRPVFRNGTPQTTKGDAFNHGIGTRSMKHIVERYGGTILFDATDETFSLDAMIPLDNEGVNSR